MGWVWLLRLVCTIYACFRCGSQTKASGFGRRLVLQGQGARMFCFSNGAPRAAATPMNRRRVAIQIHEPTQPSVTAVRRYVEFGV